MVLDEASQRLSVGRHEVLLVRKSQQVSFGFRKLVLQAKPTAYQERRSSG